MDPSSHEALLRWRDAGTLTWRGPALMLFARAALAVGAQAIVAAVFASRSSPTPWHGAEPWLPAPTPPVGSCRARPPSRTSWAPALASTYGYLVPGFQVLRRSTGLAVPIVAFVWSSYDAAMHDGGPGHVEQPTSEQAVTQRGGC